MSNEINLNTAIAFKGFMKQARRFFPQFAKEIDRCLFDVGQKNVDGCNEKNCDCQMTFEQFHERQNLVFGTGEKANV